ncbi:class I adenylate-forming enzyme family protein [Nocardioides nitrophenolicus]|uniref:class I adenylate-forming enzyme family protein n=1 Tax=Nocardioides nitrophenolicus TaxID=60489 RepID=UPI00195CBC15|nr:class I adenylate-forming enzyme family protein [Nocardioides nitrophenolicus]MBM7519346.1 fatty-acyl-CoA synthase [Nocardioides nitrophenolicus]
MTLDIASTVARFARVRPTAPAATLGLRVVSFAELDDGGNRAARAFATLGVGAGDIVGWWAAPSLRALDGFLGAGRIGAIFAPLNPALPPAELAGVLDYVAPRLLVTDLDHLDEAEQVARERELPLAVIDADGTVPGADLDALCARLAAAPLDVPVDDTAPHILYLTSGSTGRPKGALVSHRASWLRSAAGGGTFGRAMRGRGGLVTGFPLFHYGGWHYVMEAWQNGRAIHLVHRADPVELLTAVERWRASAFYAIPAVWERVLDATDVPADLGSLLHADTGTSRVSPTLLERIRTRVPRATTTVLYGTTEAGSMARLHDAHAHLDSHPGSVGLATPPGVLWTAEDGEIRVASPTLMTGYLDRPEETARVLVDGVYHSGDVGELDEDGYLTITGRVSELIRSGGETVWPTEVEAALRGLPGCADYAVVGVPDDRWGEVICLAVLAGGDGAPPPDVETVRRMLDGRLARHKHPRLVVGVPEIPRTAATGQVQRRVLVARIGQQRLEGAR